MPVQTAIQVRRGTAASWTSTNPTLAAGEIGFETDTNRFKIGTGSTAWASLNYFAQDPVTTKGDLYTFSTTDTRLAVGNNGETLVADSSTSTGLRWQSPVNANPILNSSFQIWQRGTSGTQTSSVGYPSADRWNVWASGVGSSVTLSRQVTNDTTNLPFIQYAGRFQRVAGNTNTSGLFLGQALETINSIPYAGRTVTVSFYARKGANYSSASDRLDFELWSNTTTDASFTTMFTGKTNAVQTQVTLTSTWQRFTATGTVSSSATQLAATVYYTPVGTAGANDWFEITGIQIEIGSVATPFKTNGATLAGELAACQRYYIRYTSDQAYAIVGSGFATTATNAKGFTFLPVVMRTKPSSVDFSTLLFESPGNVVKSVSAITLSDNSSPNIAAANFTCATGLTAGQAGYIGFNNSTSAYLGFSAEL